jgi:hypothetical protein
VFGTFRVFPIEGEQDALLDEKGVNAVVVGGWRNGASLGM